MAEEVIQAKITLELTSPPIWRRIEVPSDYTFYDLHCAIQDCMGWDDDHEHEFYFFDTESRERMSLSRGYNREEHELRIAEFLKSGRKRVKYVYDFGDSWFHLVVFEKVVPAEKGAVYPRCVAGKRAAPPDDCGGVFGYYDWLEVLKDPSHPDYEFAIGWFGEDFDPDDFDPSRVTFRRCPLREY